MDALLDKIGDTQVLSTLDLTKVYWQILLAKDDHPKTAFTTLSRLHQFTKVPFGLNEAATFFQKVMDKANIQDCAVTYIDDILVFSPSWEAHMMHMKPLLDALRKTGLTANLKKSWLGHTAVQYMGFCIGQGKIWVRSQPYGRLSSRSPRRTANVSWAWSTTTSSSLNSRPRWTTSLTCCGAKVGVCSPWRGPPWNGMPFRIYRWPCVTIPSSTPPCPTGLSCCTVIPPTWAWGHC